MSTADARAVPGRWPHSRAARGAVYAALVVLGALTGAAGTLVQGGWFPLGLLLALAAAVGLFRGGGILCRTKGGTVAPAAGWVAAVLLMMPARPEGDILFSAGISSYVYLIGGMLAAVMLTTLALSSPPVPGHNNR
ncbi:DUF6113 family protein [Streptomyces albus]|uniref:DUF6113 family protein n=1 Tax=Streptomyces sp. PHES57 TaxID=2872626 RepID=UPI001CEDCDE8|nr:DUF6113 family protein [Streptomyces sp. PHES57]